ncbi:MAG: alpha/beta fold hydrolase [Halobacteriota archaeon]
MNFRGAIGYAVAGAGAVAAINATLRRRSPDLDPALNGTQKRFHWRGFDVAYTEAGDSDDPDLVLLHGVNAAGSSGEYRAIFDSLSEEYHVVAPDLPGFGRSDRPPLRYSAPLYEDFLAAFLATFENPTVIASSLSAAYVVVAAKETELSSLLLICPTTVAGPEPPKGWLLELLRAPIVGEALFNLLTSKPSIRYFNDDHGYYDPSNVSEEWEAYEWATAHQPNARFAPASFISGYLNSEANLAAVLGSIDVPVTIVWGREAEVTPLAQGRELAADAGVKLVVFDDAKLLPHVEFPQQFLDVVAEQQVRASVDTE